MSKKEDVIFWGVIGTLIIIEALSVIGKSAGYWETNFPFWGTIFVWIGFAIVYTAIRKLYFPKKNQPNAYFWNNDSVKRWFRYWSSEDSNANFWTNNYSNGWFRRWNIWNNNLCNPKDKQNDNIETCC